MDNSIITAMAAVLGSFVGGSATVATAWITQKTVNKREMIHGEIRRREALYGEFISECSKLIIDSYANKLEKPETLLSVYALLNRIRLSASQPVLAEADELIRQITHQYFSPNLSSEEMYGLVRSAHPDPLKLFGEACRSEFDSLWKVV
jgi:hypothetical protein